MIGSKTIVALCTTRINEPDTIALVDALGRDLWPMNCKLLVYCTRQDLYWDSESEKGEATIYELIDYSIVDVVIICTQTIKDKKVIDKIISDAQTNNVPVITIGEPKPKCVNIFFDYNDGIRQMIEHVVNEHGVRDLHFISGMRDNEYSEARNKTFIDTIQRLGIPFDDSMLSYGGFWAGPTIDVVMKLIKEKRVPRAIICANDSMAVATCETLIHSGFRVPEDVIVTGFDGIEEIYFSRPTITSCECRFEDISEKISEILSDVIEGYVRNRDYVIKPQAMLGMSCGCEKNRNNDAVKYINTYRDKYQDSINFEKHISRMPSMASLANNVTELANCFVDDMITDVACLVNHNILEDYTNTNLDAMFEDNMIMLFDADSETRDKNSFSPCEFQRKAIAPNLEAKIANSRPTIFYALNIDSKPMGFACFQFYNSAYWNYSRVPLMVSMLDNALGLYKLRHKCNEQREK